MGLPSAVAKSTAVLVATVAIGAGSVAKLRPDLFMNLPFPLSIILWTATGSGGVPPYFIEEAWAEDEIKTWTRDGDLVVSTGAKSGTNWMLYCTHQIRLKGADDADELFNDVSEATPWPDLRQSRNGTWADQKERMNTTILGDGTPLKDRWDNPRYPFRIFKSHFGPKESGGTIPVRAYPKLRFLAMTRNGLDVVNSMTYFFSAHSDEFRNLWGGFPPDSTGDIAVDSEARLQELSPGGLLQDIYFKYVTSWWPMRHEPNVLLMHYADAKKDLRGTVQRIADFVDVELSEEEVDKVTDRCGFKHMKKMQHLFDYSLPLNQDESWDNSGRIMKPNNLIRQGKNGGGKEFFSDDQIARWTQTEEDVLGSIDEEMLNWARNGGTYS